MTKLTKEILEEFEGLLRAYGDGYYWQAEGWTEEHEKMLPDAEEKIKSFLQEVVKRAYEEGQKDLAKDIEVLTSLIPNASVFNKKEE